MVERISSRRPQLVEPGGHSAGNLPPPRAQENVWEKAQAKSQAAAEMGQIYRCRRREGMCGDFSPCSLHRPLDIQHFIDGGQTDGEERSYRYRSETIRAIFDSGTKLCAKREDSASNATCRAGARRSQGFALLRLDGACPFDRAVGHYNGRRVNGTGVQ
jgi:hypothetical protein